ncbi:MAG TPA: DUF1549 and DUF1553 domain-containing protein, partial [Verrucomicrobiae bacterium]|nr:DUF1549 and DUF1553 domain-containing protein [Verrucomicrobiae bacterium]
NSWPYRKPAPQPIPEVKNSKWPRNTIDYFILSKIEAKDLTPAPSADKRTLIRRATFDLIGLPPTPEEIDAFLADTSTNAFAKIIDRLLDSPHYGERWARHWLDLVRYTDSFDSRGIGGEGDVAEAYRYRDWVVKAFNRDLPYDEFIVEQIAGDILATNVAGRFDADKLVATGVYVIGEWGTGDADKEKMLTDIVDDQVDLTSRAFLGLTVACARCHDHKFDPISTADYYGMAGIFFSSHILPNPGAKTAGSPVLRIPLASREELEGRQQEEKRLEALAATLPAARLTNLARNIHGKTGVHALQNPGRKDTPSLTANLNDKEVKFITITMPPRSIAVHPSPKAGVSVAWKSPVAGRVKISGRVADADGNCGNGIDWALHHGTNKIAAGAIDNGGSASIPEQHAEFQSGDVVRLVISPKGEYSCDTTVVDLQITQADRRWQLTSDLLAALERDEPSDVWAAYDLGPKPPGPPPVPVAHGIQEGGTPKSAYEGIGDARIHMRGRYDKLGEVTPRRFPKVLAGDEIPKLTGSGRLELARWIASPENPQTARVMVNRIWQHHFGEGIVRTPNNYGKLGSPPTHPELLDYLALEFIKSGWSIKAMHRAVMLSATWQQSSVPAADVLKADPENLLFARMNRRRLESEAIRDSLLAVANRLDRTPGGPSVRALETPRRTLYVTTVRSERATFQCLFDAADATTIAEKRNVSTVAPQALFLMNNPFALEQADALAKRAPEKDRIPWLYRLLYGRQASAREIQLGEAAVEASSWADYCHVLLCANEFVYID